MREKPKSGTRAVRKLRDRCVVITGFMGSGKTSVALALGRLLKRRAIDLDKEITRSEKQTPGQLIMGRGERAFRQIETDVLQKVVDDGARLIALGGGAWTIARNRDLLNAAGCFTVWIDLPFESCWKRITSSDANRPLAATKTRARALFKKRRQIYKLANMRIEATEEMKVSEISKQIAKAIKSRAVPPAVAGGSR